MCSHDAAGAGLDISGHQRATGHVKSDQNLISAPSVVYKDFWQWKAFILSLRPCGLSVLRAYLLNTLTVVPLAASQRAVLFFKLQIQKRTAFRLDISSRLAGTLAMRYLGISTASSLHSHAQDSRTNRTGGMCDGVHHGETYTSNKVVQRIQKNRIKERGWAEQPLDTRGLIPVTLPAAFLGSCSQCFFSYSLIR
ncbi:hypothetical protein TGME49_269705 [Toxoplasma gondii ME49]|uniref:Uncharacterized protein n=1 Tax=Toxoplasma gondii (strain ATCC 50611 / Me49) TaxID=508771 RepID=S8G9E9_TOXGM|nr:hypothetical protein TGME49_269705 [Toxoplasma gondii ME49]EPT28355.1 hypothetical protein TGME49_269705 [Toxoplasma gondii ME49]|eukprot:XP_018636590.1 hypothetical protein TGME49_269705 [Toxoplasma gondii ME49]